MNSLLTFLWLLICAFAGGLATNWALHPVRHPLPPEADILARDLSARNHAVFQSVSLTVDDGAVLQGRFIHTLGGNNNSVILLHGQADNREGMLGAAELMLRHGYSVLMPDARAQGTSGGKLVTYGVMEAEDLRGWFNWLKNAQPTGCIYGLGDSMGAAELLQSLESEKSFCAVVSESPFVSFREASYDRIGQWLATGPWIGQTFLRPVVWFGLLYARWHYGVDLAQSDPGEAVAASRVPVMLIHGLRDNNLPPRHSETILDHARGRNRNVLLWEPPDAGHCGAASAEPGVYERRVIDWFAANNNAPSR